MEENSGNQTQPASVSQLFQGAQTPPTPNVAQPSVQPVQPAQPGFQQQRPPPTATNVVTTQTGADNQTTGKKKSKLKYLAYFLLGLVLSVLGLLIGVIWIIVKEEQAKMRKVIALLLGVTLSVVVWFVIAGGITFEGTTMTSTINTSQPRSIEEKEIISDLTKLYPNQNFQVAYGEHKPPLTIGNTTISTFVKVEISSDSDTSPEMISETGKQVCATMDRLQVSVSQVEVATVNKKSVISQSLSGIGGTCEEYSTGEILNTLQSM